MSRQFSFSPRWVEVVDDGVPVQPGRPGVVFSRRPHICATFEGDTYIVKGAGDPAIVVSEVVGYSLARLAGVVVPEFALTRVNGACAFASREVPGAIRDVDTLLVSRHAEALARIAVVDVWLANPDRNIGNVVRGVADGDEALFAIDYEKIIPCQSDGVERFGLAGLHCRRFLPQGELAGCRFRPSTPDIDAVSTIGDHAIESVFAGLSVVPGFDWADAAATLLKSRRSKIRDLMREALA